MDSQRDQKPGGGDRKGCRAEGPEVDSLAILIASFVTDQSESEAEVDHKDRAACAEIYSQIRSAVKAGFTSVLYVSSVFQFLQIYLYPGTLGDLAGSTTLVVVGEVKHQLVEVGMDYLLSAREDDPFEDMPGRYAWEQVGSRGCRFCFE